MPLENKPSILIVDDTEENLFFLEVILKKLNVNIIMALSGSEALEKIKGTEIALAIIDVRMPDINGYELAVLINKERLNNKIPIIFITANYANDIDMFDGYSSGAIDYIFKPFNKQILFSKINVFLDLFNQKQIILQNVAQLKKSTEEITMINSFLTKSEEKYRTMLNASPNGIFITNLEGIITDVSEIGLALFGFNTKDYLAGKSIFEIVEPEEKNILREIFVRTSNEGIIQNFELRIKKTNNTYFLSEISITLIQDKELVPFAFMLIMRDISQRAKIETKQIHADRMANLGEMAAGIAHEINQPLNIISLVMDKILFESSQTNTIEIEFFKKKSNKIFENILRIRNIIDHIRAFSRSHNEYLLTSFDINSSIKNAISMISEQFKHLDIKLNIQLENDLPLLLGNTFQLEQVVINLLINAKDAVIEKKNKLKDSYEMKIDIKSYYEYNNLIIEINDNGIGILYEDINNVILPFYTTKSEGKGTGIGLSICYQLIKEMNGTIDIKSNRFDGTKIKLTISILKKN